MSRIWTVGHWNCPEDTFVGVLREPGVELVADIRAHPGSRSSPQFGLAAMQQWLARAGVGYVHLPQLGGRRGKQDVEDSVNAGWRVRSFHNYADYTLSAAYEQGIGELLSLASTHRAAVLCAEPMPWRCHRLLVANTLVARGHDVWHLFAGRRAQQHELGMWGAQPQCDDQGRLTYPGTG